MTIRIAIIGPGRVGQALARRWREAGAEVLGFVARRSDQCAAAIAFVGAGRSLGLDELWDADVLALTLTEDVIEPMAILLSRWGRLRTGILALHVAGSRGREVLAPLEGRDLLTAVLHPLAPFPDPERGYRAMVGRHALCTASPASTTLIGRLAEMAGMRAVFAPDGIDRVRYHLACALSANGVTALLEQASRQMVRALGVEPQTATALCADLAMSAASLCTEVSPRQALSGPVHRGDAPLVARHVSLLAADDARTAASYRALMLEALDLAAASGLSRDLVAAVAQALGTPSGSGEPAAVDGPQDGDA